MSRAHHRIAGLVNHLSTGVPAAAPATIAAAPAPCAAGAAAGAGAGAAAPDLSALQNVKVERKGRVAIVQMHRPNALNALSDGLIADISTAFLALQADQSCGCVVLTGVGRAFAAGADIKEMAGASFGAMTQRDKLATWRVLSEMKLPVIAAVNGLALGGGCEIALMCDIIIASDTAVFGQPEILLGILPGAGGTQRLPRFIGKSKAMEMCLTGKPISAAEAERFGLCSRVVPADQLMDVAVKMATTIASYSRPATLLTKESVAAAYETTLQTGLGLERKLFQMTWGYDDAREGTKAFAEKRKPNWQHK